KSAYRSPTRGLQGNASKLTIGIPYALGSRHPVVIEGRGVRHVINTAVDPGGEVRVDRRQEEARPREGPVVSLVLPASAWGALGAVVRPLQPAPFGKDPGNLRRGLPR